ncbi:MAG: bifunctional methylenetetrahydrofolate dehydrogenase/methenyltetrahydrofolate cyclohydrolase FolD [Gammaproteobacteria bacterium]
MPAQILDGNAIAKTARAELRAAVARRAAVGQRPPGLAVILVGSDPASEIYVKGKRRDCEEVGFHSNFQHLSANVTQADLEERIEELNEDTSIDGILVQSPLPTHINENRIIDRIDPLKDVDGFHPYNIGRLALRRPSVRSCTPMGIMQLLAHTGVEIRGLDATVIGASNHVGRPMGLELLLAGCTVTTAHKFSRDTAGCVKWADIVVSAVGKPGLVPGSWIKPGAIVIDVGITRDKRGKLHGDVVFEEAREVASWITPVPGGVGPMTRVAMLQNTLAAAEHALDIPDRR